MWRPYGYEVSTHDQGPRHMLTSSTVSQGEAFRTGNFIWQERAMDALLYGLEQTMVGFT